MSGSETTRLEVRVTIDLPAPIFRGTRHGDVLYAAIPDVLAFLEATASAFDKAHANADIGNSFRACRASIEEAAVKEFA